MPPSWSNIMVTPMQKYVRWFSWFTSTLLSFGKRACKVFAQIRARTDPSWFRTDERSRSDFLQPSWAQPGQICTYLYFFVRTYIYGLLYCIFATIVEVKRGQIWDLEALKCPFSASLKYVLGSTEHHHHSSAMMGAFFACVWVKVLWEVRRPGL